MQVESILTKLADKLMEWVNTLVLMLPNLAVALIVLVIAWFASRAARKIAARVFLTMNETSRQLLANLASSAVFLAGVSVALSILQLDGAVASLLAGAGILGLALGFAFQDLAANFISGVGLSFRSVLQPGDIIEANGEVGVAEKIELRSTLMRTFEGDLVIIPNKDIYQSKVKIHGQNQTRRIDLAVGVSYGDDLEKVRRVTLEAVGRVPHRAPDRLDQFFFTEFGDSSINLTVQFWVRFEKQADFMSARSEAIMQIKRAFDEASITIPFPIRTLDFGIKGGATLLQMLPHNGATPTHASAS